MILYRSRIKEQLKVADNAEGGERVFCAQQTAPAPQDLSENRMC